MTSLFVFRHFSKVDKIKINHTLIDNFLWYFSNFQLNLSYQMKNGNIGPCRYLEKLKFLSIPGWHHGLSLDHSAFLSLCTSITLQLSKQLNHADNRQSGYRVVKSFSLMSNSLIFDFLDFFKLSFVWTFSQVWKLNIFIYF